MTHDPYSERVRRLFRETAHAGEPDDAVRVEHASDEARIALSARVADGRVVALRFRAWGCPHVIAACEAFCAEFEGEAASRLEAFRAADLMRSLPVPAEKMGRILVLEDAARSLGQNLRRGTG